MKVYRRILFIIIGVLIIVVLNKIYTFYNALKVFEYTQKPGISTYKIASKIDFENYKNQADSSNKFSLKK